MIHFIKLLLLLCLLSPAIAKANDYSLTDFDGNKIIATFVNQVITQTNPYYLEPQNRIAVISKFSCTNNQLSCKSINQLIRVLKENDFTVYLISGNGTDSVQVLTDKEVTQETDTLPTHSNESEQLEKPSSLSNNSVIDLTGSTPVNDIRIDKLIGAQPILALGVCDADIPMLQFTATNTPSLPIVLRLQNITNKKLLSLAKQNQWMIIDPAMKGINP